MNFSYKHTLAASYTGYITQAAINNLPPLLFTAFCRDFNITLTQLSALITVNFVTQLIVDGLSVKFLDKIGMRAAAVAAHFFAAMGFIMFSVMPFTIDPFAGLCAAMMISAVGGGLTEVVISPIVEAVPGDAKASAMSLLHSFYCWGQMGVVLISTLYFVIFGADSWRYLPLIWAVIPLINAFFFMKVPIGSLMAEGDSPMPLKELFCTKMFRLLLLLMICAGASELAMSQWSSFFAETGLNVSKTLGDLLGPCGFAILMGCARLFYGIKGENIPLEKILRISCGLCIISYLTAVFAPVPLLSLAGCALCGLSVGMLWPGTFSIASRECPRGGGAMFALLALAGDMGCASGPYIVGIISDKCSNFSAGLMAAAIFPVIMLIAVPSKGNKKTA